MPALLIVKSLTSPRVFEFNPFGHLLETLGFLFLIHVSSLSSFLCDLSEAKNY